MDNHDVGALLGGANFHSYSANFAVRSDSDDEDSAGDGKLGFDDGSLNYQKAPRVFDRFYNSSSSEDDEDDVSSSTNYQRRLDHMLQFLDRKLSTSSSPEQPLPEFTSSGGGAGIFRPPVRAPVHPNRPPSIEIRPHPLRETQVGRFLRRIASVDDGNGPQLWAGSECGIRVWDLKNDIYGGATEGEEEGTVRYWESAPVAGAAFCVVGDGGNRVMWSGHKDGRIMCWKMMDFSSERVNGRSNGVNKNEFQEVFSWQAHRGPVLSMVVSSSGNLDICCSFLFVLSLTNVLWNIRMIVLRFE